MQQNQNRDETITTAQALGLLYFIARCHAHSITVFTRHRFGTRAFAPHAIFTLVLLVMLAAEYTGFGWMLVSWFTFLIIHRIESYLHKGTHSKFVGVPWMGLMFPFAKTRQHGYAAEALYALVVGCMLAEIAPELGLFIGLGAVSLSVTMGIEQLVLNEQLRAMRDAEIEVNYYTDEYRRRL